MNYQREAVYARRRNALSGERIEIDVQNMMQDTAMIIAEKSEGMLYEDFEQYVIATLSIDLGFTKGFYEQAKPRDVAEKLYAHMQEVYNRRMQTMTEKANPIVKQIYERNSPVADDVPVTVPITDGKRIMNLPVNLKKAYETDSKEIVKALCRAIILYQIDEYWKQHLRDMDDLRQSVQNAAYEQKDPLVVYKLESYNLFSQMLEELNEAVLTFLLRADIPLADAPDRRRARTVPTPSRDMSQMRTNDPSQLSTNGEPKSRMPVHVEKKIGRNDPCPCGSGLKYKNCHGKNL